MPYYIPFIAGVAIGAAAMQILRREKTQASLQKAKETLQETTSTGLNKLKSATQRVRQGAADAIDKVKPEGSAAVAPEKTEPEATSPTPAPENRVP